MSVCLHCGEVRDDMELLVTGEPSHCCSDCWQDYLTVSKQHINEMVNGGWQKTVKAEEKEADRRAKLKDDGKKKAEPEKDYGGLWLVK